MGHKTNGRPEGHRGGPLAGSGSAQPTNRQPAKKIFNKKGVVIGSFTEADVERDKREEQEWLKQGDLTRDACEAGREAMHDSLVAEERCRDLADRFARRSAKKTADDVLEVRDRYERIAEQFRATGYTLLAQCNTATAVKEFLAGEFATSIKDYVRYRLRSRSYQLWWKLNGPMKGHHVATEMMILLALEDERDCRGLMCFLEAVLNRWRKIFEHRSLLRVRILTLRLANDHGHDRKRILSHLQTVGAIPKHLTLDNQRAWLLKIGQFCSRDLRLAKAKREGLLLPVTKIA